MTTLAALTLFVAVGNKMKNRKLDTFKRPEQAKIIQLAERYAASEKSDPFAKDRIRTHLGNGVASQVLDDNGNTKDAWYTAMPDGTQRARP